MHLFVNKKKCVEKDKYFTVVLHDIVCIWYTYEHNNNVNKYNKGVRKMERDFTDLTKQLEGLEGWRVEVETTYGEKRRFIVGRSTGVRPIHLEVLTRRSLGGCGAEREYAKVTRLYQVR